MSEALSGKTLGFLGAGNMAEALVSGVLRSGLLAPENIFLSDVSEKRLEKLRSQHAVQIVSDNKKVAEKCDIVILAVKPQNIGEVLDEVGAAFGAHQLLISIAAGVRIAAIQDRLNEGVAVIRVMPNTPMLVGAGMSALALGSSANERHGETAGAIFRSAGKVIFVEEGLMDAVTAVSGSGPAYLFYLVEAMVSGGVAAGLDEDTALNLATQTVLGAAKLLIEGGDLPGVPGVPEKLRRKVTSPGGTTEAAIKSMESAGVRSAIVEAVKAAAQRSAELGG